MAIQSIRCALPFCARVEEEQTKCSLISRVAALGMGGIILMVGILALSGIPGLHALGTVGGAVLTSIGSWILLTGLCLRCIKWNEDYSYSSLSDEGFTAQGVSDPSPVRESQKQLSDEEIIQNLQSQGYSHPIEEGSDGRCLFCSILPQITDADIKKGLSSKYAEYFGRWDDLLESGMTTDDKLDRLRQMALAEEEDFSQFLARLQN